MLKYFSMETLDKTPTTEELELYIRCDEVKTRSYRLIGLIPDDLPKRLRINFNKQVGQIS